MVGRWAGPILLSKGQFPSPPSMSTSSPPLGSTFHKEQMPSGIEKMTDEPFPRLVLSSRIDPSLTRSAALVLGEGFISFTPNISFVWWGVKDINFYNFLAGGPRISHQPHSPFLGAFQSNGRL